MLIAAGQSRPGRMPKITDRRSYANKPLGKEFASNTSLSRRVAKWTAECHQNAFLPLRFMCRGRQKTAAVHDLDERQRERPQSNSLDVQWDCVGYSDRPVNFRTVDIGKTQHFRRMNVLNFPTSGPLPAIMSQTCSANCDLFCNSCVFICSLAVCRTLSST